MRYGIWDVSCPDGACKTALEEGGLSHLTSLALSARGFDGAAQAREFLSHDESRLHDPYLLRDMDKAVKRIKTAIEKGEKIAIYGDYDVDGITATCLMTDYLRAMGAQVIFYIPERVSEGYGLNPSAVESLVSDGVTLIITVDCGVTAIEEVNFAAWLGADVIITDHHECKAELPAAVAVIDPRRPDCEYPFDGLAGVGVAFKLCCALGGLESARYLAQMAAVGTIADVMPMTDENRAIVHMGLRQLEKEPRMGFRQILTEAGLAGKTLSTMDIGFSVAPKINATGRMSSAETAVRLLLTEDETLARRLVGQLGELNINRQTIESEIYFSAKEKLAQQPPKGVIVLSDDGWHQGVVGIVASRLAEEYRCRAFLISMSGDYGKASCRGWGSQSLIAAMEYASDALESFGGHEMAAGFTIRREKIEQFRDLMEKYAALEEQGLSENSLHADCVVEPADLTLPDVQSLFQLEPCGVSNPYPTFVMEDVVIDKVSEVGGGRHLKFTFAKNDKTIDAIFFSANREQLRCRRGDLADVAFSPRVNEFRGSRTVQMHIVDVRPAKRLIDALDRAAAGEEIPRAEAGELLPDRGDMTVIWRRLQSGHCSFWLSGRTLACLEAFRQGGLVTVERRCGEIRAEIIPGCGKADLEKTDIIINLRRCAQ
ncbi:MAG: single-stranded-DNA-specific exonuclease RecJ [Oscillospiraceae bacterium]|nr:single-stranded-DNA-specific exonuclease RecJ [Oscillospiraceae bacterium]